MSDVGVNKVEGFWQRYVGFGDIFNVRSRTAMLREEPFNMKRLVRLSALNASAPHATSVER
jgi:hypothetical protein